MTILLVLFITGIAWAAGNSDNPTGYSTPYSEYGASDFNCFNLSRWTFPDTTSASQQEYYPLMNWGADPYRGYLSLAQATASNKLNLYLQALGFEQSNGQWKLYNTQRNGAALFGDKGNGAYTLYPSSLNPNSSQDRQTAWSQYTDQNAQNGMKGSFIASLWNTTKWQINLRPDLYNSDGTARAPGWRIDGYFLPPDFEVLGINIESPGYAKATFRNNYPLHVYNVPMYLYAVKSDGTIQQIASAIQGINGNGGQYTIQGNYPAGTTKLVATIGAPWKGGSWQDSVNASAASVYTQYNGTTLWTLTGKAIELGSDLYRSDTKALLANRWNNNYLEYANPPAPPSGGGGSAPPPQPSNLAAYMISPVDPNTGISLPFVTPSTQFKMSFTYYSSFDQSGPATIRLYEEDPSTYEKTLLAEQTVTVSKGQATTTFDKVFSGLSEGKHRYIATIDLKWAPGWTPEKFNGQDESTYDDNKVETDVYCSLGGPPTGVGYWPPVVEKDVPIYATVPVWGWKKVDYVHDKEPKLKIRLIQ